MNFDDRAGNQDVDAAALFAAARSFRPSARGRRRVLRALGLPIGLSLFGSGLAHAAYLLSSSLKGWGMVAGVVATVGAAGGVTYVVIAPSTPIGAVSKQMPGPLSPPAGAVPAPMRSSVAVEAEEVGQGAGVPVPGLSEAALADVSNVPNVPTGDAVPTIAAASLPGVDRSLARPVQRSVNRLSMRPEPRALPSRRLADPGDPSPTVPSKSSREESPIEAAPLPSGIVGLGIAPSEPSPPVAAPAVAPPPFRPSSESATPRPRPATDVGRPAPLPAILPVFLPVSSSLKGELALVAEAQARLRVEDAPGAFAALDRYVRLYPAGALAEEVELLRVRAFIANGDARAARTTGEAFLQHHPASPLRARFRSLMNALDVPAIR